MTDQPPSLPEPSPLLRLEPGPPGTDSVTVRISPSYTYELLYLLKSHGLRYSEIFEATWTSDLSIYAVYSVGALSALGGFSGLAKVLTAFFSRHDGKRFTVVINGEEYSTEGTSLKDAERWIELTLEKRAELEGRWAEMRKPLEDDDIDR